MTEKSLRDRLALLKQERETTRLTVIAYDGAIQECEYWLSQIAPPDVQELFPGAVVEEFPTASSSE